MIQTTLHLFFFFVDIEHFHFYCPETEGSGLLGQRAESRSCMGSEFLCIELINMIHTETDDGDRKEDFPSI